MNPTHKTIELRFERTIPASADEVFAGWLSAEVPGTPWNAAEKFILQAHVDGLFYWTLKGTAHYGRFIEFVPTERMQHTWMSSHTLGLESLVTLTFKPQGENTLLTLVHSGLPDHDLAKGHMTGWNYFLDVFQEQFGAGSRKAYRWEDAHPHSSKSS